MSVFSSNEFTDPETLGEPQCKCGAQPRIVRKMMDPRTGITVRMFECQCGERSWTEVKEVRPPAAAAHLIRRPL
jgi:hypothetical protein